MLVNLKRALDNKGISLKAYAAVIGVSEKTAWNKINGETDLTYPEAFKTKNELFPEFDFNYLFEPDNSSKLPNKKRA